MSEREGRYREVQKWWELYKKLKGGSESEREWAEDADTFEASLSDSFDAALAENEALKKEVDDLKHDVELFGVAIRRIVNIVYKLNLTSDQITVAEAGFIENLAPMIADEPGERG